MPAPGLGAAQGWQPAAGWSGRSMSGDHHGAIRYPMYQPCVWCSCSCTLYTICCSWPVCSAHHGGVPKPGVLPLHLQPSRVVQAPLAAPTTLGGRSQPHTPASCTHQNHHPRALRKYNTLIQRQGLPKACKQKSLDLEQPQQSRSLPSQEPSRPQPPATPPPLPPHHSHSYTSQRRLMRLLRAKRLQAPSASSPPPPPPRAKKPG